MKNSRILVFVGLISTIIMISCTSQRDKDAKSIAALEKDLTTEAERPQQDKLDELMQGYLNFVDKHPQDTSASQYLYKALNLAMGTNQGEKAMELADRTLNDYPKSEKIAETVFLKAFIYENLLSNLGLAQKTYNDFLSRFPDHELADDAQAALDNLGKSPEEMIREFEKKAAEAAAAKTE